MAKLNHESTVDRAGTLSLLLSSALYFTLRTAGQMLNGTQSWSVYAFAVGWGDESWLFAPGAGLWDWDLPNHCGAEQHATPAMRQRYGVLPPV